ncbi:hypothetical protein BC830DRAFT_1147008 [Chytriomyces sp. MP71]|nr:hypothetical protein BC830DRAFT_1147008 [Chytriomyces sp. MP71]
MLGVKKGGGWNRGNPSLPISCHRAGTMDPESIAQLLVTDYRVASQRGSEAQLWKQFFYGPIGTFRASISIAKKERNAPALASTQALFRAFLDDAIVFYAQLIVRLANAHSLKRVARVVVASGALKPFTLGMPDQPPLDERVDKDQVVLTCFQCLIYLGDLARYRDSTAPAPSPAPKFYYNLAHILVPSSGNPFNQLAVLPQAASNDLTAADLYARALCCSRPFPTARRNLELCLARPRAFDGTDAILEAARVLLLGPSTGAAGKNLDDGLGADFEARVGKPVLAAWIASLAAFNLDAIVMAQIARLLIAVRALLPSASPRGTDAGRLLWTLSQECIRVSLERQNRITNVGQGVTESLADALAFVHPVLALVVRDPVQVPSHLWPVLVEFGNALMRGVDVRKFKNRMASIQKQYRGVLDAEWVGFAPLDARAFDFNTDGDFDEDLGEMAVDEDGTGGAVRPTEDDAGMEKVWLVLEAMWKVSSLPDSHIAFSGIRWRMGSEKENSPGRSSEKGPVLGRDFFEGELGGGLSDTRPPISTQARSSAEAVFEAEMVAREDEKAEKAVEIGFVQMQ